MATLNLTALASACAKAEQRPAFYNVLESGDAICTFIKPSAKAEYSKSFSGLCKIGNESYWINFAHNEVDAETPINKQVEIPVLVELLSVAPTASPEDLIKYGKKVGDTVYRVRFV